MRFFFASCLSKFARCRDAVSRKTLVWFSWLHKCRRSAFVQVHLTLHGALRLVLHLALHLALHGALCLVLHLALHLGLYLALHIALHVSLQRFSCPAQTTRFAN